MNSVAGLLQSWKGSAATFLAWWRDELWGLVPEQVRVHLASGETSLVVATGPTGLQVLEETGGKVSRRQSGPGRRPRRSLRLSASGASVRRSAWVCAFRCRAASGAASSCRWPRAGTRPDPRSRSRAVDAVQAEGCLYRRLYRRRRGRGRPDQGRPAGRQARDHRPDPGGAARRRPEGRFRRLLGRARGSAALPVNFLAAAGPQRTDFGRLVTAPAPAGGVRGAAGGRRCLC